ncbi:hypothetical protein BTZ20_2032 [Rhodococcus sp. MTM3W5.2]|nr:hypothetical protein BTZ20_2032 [Rhodococcus sp. MTM3W5.2]
MNPPRRRMRIDYPLNAGQWVFRSPVAVRGRNVSRSEFNGRPDHKRPIVPR